MNDHQAEELLELQREMLKKQTAIYKEVRAGLGCIVVFLFFFGIFCLITMSTLAKL